MRCHSLLPSLLICILLCGCAHEVAPIAQFQGLTELTSAIAWSRDGKFLAATAEGDLHVWDVASRRQVAQTSGYLRTNNNYEQTGIDFSPDSRWLAFGGEDGVVYLWDFRSGEKQELRGQSSPLRLCRFSPDGSRLATASGGFDYKNPPPTTMSLKNPPRYEPQIMPMRVVVFDVTSGVMLSDIDASGMIDIGFSNDASLFAGERLNLTPDTEWPLSMKAIRGVSARTEVRETVSGNLVASFDATGLGIRFTDDGKLWSGKNIYDTRSRQKIRDAPINGVVFVDGGKRILTVARSSNPYNLWPVVTVGWCKIAYVDIGTGLRQELGDFHGEGLPGALQHVSGYSRDRRWVVDRQMQLWPVPR